MAPYFVTIALVMLFSFLAEISRVNDLERGYEEHSCSKRTAGLLIVAVIPLIFTAGFRYRIGTDFMAYYKVTKVFDGEFWSLLWSLREPGIALLRDIVLLFSDDGAAFIFSFSLFTVVLSCIALLRRSDDYLFTLLLYVFCGCWHGAFNGVRQYLAATVILLGIHYISERKLLKYALTVFIAFLFHRSALVMIVPYFVMRNKINLRNVLLLTVGTLIVSANYDVIFRVISDVRDKEVVMDTYATASVNGLRIAANAAPAIAAIILNLNKELDEEETFCINGLIMNAAAMIAASNSTLLARIGIYTGYFIPLCLSRVIRLENKNLELLLRVGVIVLFAVFWYVEVSGYPALSPFKWVFYKGILY